MPSLSTSYNINQSEYKRVALANRTEKDAVSSVHLVLASIVANELNAGWTAHVGSIKRTRELTVYLHGVILL